MHDDINYTEIEMLQKIAGGDQQAFAELYHKYHNLLGHHIFRITESKELAEEMVQDVFLKIWMSREALAEVKNFRTWLYVISRNYTLNAMRKIIRERQLKTEWIKDTLTVETNQEENKRYTLVDEAVASLPDQQQTVYLLSREGGLTYEQIGLKMGLAKETVKYYMKLAIAAITRYILKRVDMILFFGLIY